MIIKIKNLKVVTTIGVYKWEETYQRTLVFNVEIETNFADGMNSDNLKDTIDYDVIVNQIKNFAENHHCKLIEKMVGELLDLIMQDKRIARCTLEVDKPKIYDFVDSVSVTQTRFR